MTRPLSNPAHRFDDASTPHTRREPRHEQRSRLRRVLDCGIVAVVRSPDSQQLVEVARALADGGVTVVEITMTVPDALDVLRQVRRALGDRLLLGAGTILDPETARAALLAGAEYLVAPTVNLDVIRLCQRYDKLVMPGAFTPTEILTAWEAGADIVKVFPADVVGPAFFKALRGAAAADSPDADRRRRPEDGGGLPPRRRLLSRRRQPAGRAEGRGRAQLRPHPRPGPAVRRHRRRFSPHAENALNGVNAVVPSPVAGSPQQADGTDHPGAGHPVVTGVVVPGPVAGSPQIAGAGAERLLINRQRGRSDADRDADRNLRGRCGRESCGNNQQQKCKCYETNCRVSFHHILLVPGGLALEAAAPVRRHWLKNSGAK